MTERHTGSKARAALQWDRQLVEGGSPLSSEVRKQRRKRDSAVVAGWIGDL